MIILTKNINGMLDRQKLSELTIERMDNGTISLVGKECSKELMSISSVQVSKKLTVEERRIITEDYIEPIVMKNKKMLQDIIKMSSDSTIEEEEERVLEKYKKMNVIISKTISPPYARNANKVTDITAKTGPLVSSGSSMSVSWNDKSNFSSRINIDGPHSNSKDLFDDAKQSIKNMQKCFDAVTEYKKALVDILAKDEKLALMKETLVSKCKI